MSESSSEKPKKVRIVRCPRCSKSARFDESNPCRPFCSAVCKNEDIISWATESYRIPGPPAADLPEKNDDDQTD